MSNALIITTPESGDSFTIESKLASLMEAAELCGELTRGLIADAQEEE